MTPRLYSASSPEKFSAPERRPGFSLKAPQASQSRYAVPASFSAVKAAGEAAKTADTPRVARAVCTSRPELSPSATARPALGPPATPWAARKSTSGPGATVRATETPRK